MQHPRQTLIALFVLHAATLSAQPRHPTPAPTHTHHTTTTATPTRTHHTSPTRHTTASRHTTSSRHASARRHHTVAVARPTHRRIVARATLPTMRYTGPSFAGVARPAVGTASVGCHAPVSSLHGVSDQVISVAGVDRHYLLSVPAGYDPHAGPLPLVFAFHGRTGTPTSLHGYLRLEREASGRAIFVYPAGQRDAYSDGTLGPTRWDLRANGSDVAFFDALLSKMSNDFCVDTGRVFAVGHSAGAVVTNEMGCLRGNVLRAIAPIAGSGPSARRCADTPSVWITHGHADAPVPFHYGESSRDRWASLAHCALPPESIAGTSCVRYSGCDSGVREVFCAHEGDHDPPPFAPSEIWAFFSDASAR